VGKDERLSGMARFRPYLLPFTEEELSSDD
jgi:hypothetical protein